MHKLTVRLKNCFGIKSFEHEFDFTDPHHKVYAIYAPNGCMKSSLALTFKDLKNTRDRVHPDAHSECSVLDENGVELSQKDIEVLTPYENPLRDLAKTNAAVLLANSGLREQYSAVNGDREQAQESLVKALKKRSKCKTVEAEVVKAVLHTELKDSLDFCIAVGRLERELRDQSENPYAELPYDVVFDERVSKLLHEPDVEAALDEFIAKYDELIAQSTFFRKGTFEYYHASSIAKQLEAQGFFKAKHFVMLNGAERKQITTRAELETVISEERDKITKDPVLRAKFGKVEELLTQNAACKDFRTYIMNNSAVLSKMTDVNKFKVDVWKSYLKAEMPVVTALLEKYDISKERNAEILVQAKEERTHWEQVIETFKDRFTVPVELEVKNRESLVAGDGEEAQLLFSYKDIGGKVEIGQDDLMGILSQGEKKALYILDILFTIQVRQNNNQETLFIVDDIADSFDYKNKYAIVEYLMEMADNPLFKMIILTHNFDFFRTVVGRFVGNAKCLVASRNDGDIVVDEAHGIDNIFIKEWKNRFLKDNKVRIASICFMRNLIEYTESAAGENYEKLTSLLHWKPSETPKVTQNDLNQIYQHVFSKVPTTTIPNEPMVDVIHREAQACLTAAAGINLEHKIVLSIATRLAAEKFMVDKIADRKTTDQFDRNQTHELLMLFQKKFASETAAIKSLKRAQLMTTENIHLNAFMYEPIVDISDDHLRKLYIEVSNLN